MNNTFDFSTNSGVLQPKNQTGYFPFVCGITDVVKPIRFKTLTFFIFDSILVYLILNTQRNGGFSV